MRCKGAKWVDLKTKSEDISDCQGLLLNPEPNRFTWLNLLVIADCELPCENQGICIRPNVCHCPEGWDGSQCQIKTDKPCLSLPHAPSESTLICEER